MSLDETIRSLYVDALRRHNGIQSRAAEDLSVAKSTFCREYKRYGITDEEIWEETDAIQRAIAECEAIRERSLKALRAENQLLRSLAAGLPENERPKVLAAGA